MTLFPKTTRMNFNMEPPASIVMVDQGAMTIQESADEDKQKMHLRTSVRRSKIHPRQSRRGECRISLHHRVTRNDSALEFQLVRRPYGV
jgi:hypothetical protein